MSEECTLPPVLCLFQTFFELQAATKGAFYQQATNYVALMGYTILVWDHVITFQDEVQYIWTRPKSPAAYLFFLNRYFTPVAFIGNLVAYFSDWSKEVCNKFVRYEGSCTIIALEVAALMMLLRVVALYREQRLIVGSVIILLLIETGIFAWLMTRSMAVQHHYTVEACTMIFNSNRLGDFAPSLSAWMPLLYDSYVTALTFYKCMPRVRTSSASYIFRVLLRDGLVYYSVIFMINLILALMIVAAPDQIKNITAQLEQMLTVAMISRITLSLRRSAYERNMGYVSTDDNVHRFQIDAWQSARQECAQMQQTVHSSTVCQHVSVIPGSGLTSASPLPSRVTSMLHDEEVERDKDNDHYSYADLGTDSIGVLSISAAHTHEAAIAAGIGITASPVVVTDPLMMNHRNAYELRVMRPARTHTHTSGKCLRF